jgi:hypothetical protein
MVRGRKQGDFRMNDHTGRIAVPTLVFLLAPALAYLSYVTNWNEVPWPGTYRRSDDLIYLLYAKNFAESWTVYRLDRLAAPFSYATHDFPFFTTFNFAMIALLDLVFRKIQVSVLAYQLLCIGVSGALTCILLQRVRVHDAICFTAALAYALTPYVLTRNVNHLDYAIGFLFPLFLIILHKAWRIDHAAERGGWQLICGGILFGILATLQQFYHAFFLMIFIGAAALMLLAPRRSWWTLGVCAAMGLGIAASFLLFVAVPSWEATGEIGRNLTYTQRSLKSLNFFSLLPTHLVLPQEFHRLRSISLVKQSLHAEMNGGIQVADIWTHSLGVFGVAGLLFLIGRAMTPFRLERPYPRASADTARERLEMAGMLSLMTLAGVLYAIPAGGATLFGYFVTPQMHGSQRISLPIACFAAVGTALVLQSFYERLADRPQEIRLPRAISGHQWMWIGAALMSVFIYLDQTVDFRRRTYYHPDTTTAAARMAADRTYFQQLESKLPKGAGVYHYPHGPWSGLMPWENAPLRPVIATDTLRWSVQPTYARQAHNWSIELAHLTFDRQMERLREKGFSAVVVNTKHYETGRQHAHFPYPLALPDFLAALGQLSPEPPLVSPDGEFQTFLLPWHASAALKRNCEPYVMGTRIGFAAEDRNYRYFDIGWGLPQPAGGTWMARVNGFPAHIRLCPDQRPTSDLELEIEVDPNVHPASPRIQMDVIVNGTTLQQREFTLAGSPGRQTMRVPVPMAVAASRPLLTIGFRYYRGEGQDIGPGAVGAVLHALTVR